MIASLRIVSFLAGVVLMVFPSLLFLQIGYGVDESPSYRVSIWSLFPIGMGLVLGGGLLLAGLPKVVVGPARPVAQFIAGILIAVSSATFLFFVGFSGSVTKIASPAILFLEAVVFGVFVWPAVKFRQASEGEAQ